MGALLTLTLFGLELSVTAFVGVIMLVGIVKKNAIMMIDFAISAERHEGKAPYDAIVEACRLRFRPIMMTTMAALLGALPLALGAGDGAELRRPLGIAIGERLSCSPALPPVSAPIGSRARGRTFFRVAPGAWSKEHPPRAPTRRA